APVRVVDVMLIFDAVTLLSSHPEASRTPDAPTPVGAQCCYAFAPGAGAPTAPNSGRLTVCAPIGALVRIRAATPSLLTEHAVLVTSLQLSGARALSDPQPVVNSHAEALVPQLGEQPHPARHRATDAFWQMQVLAHEPVEARIDATLLDREANVLGCFRWQLAIDFAA
ncbi:AidA/PixA family protein, partial [Ralstonia pseudosolanacearum]